MNNLKLTKKQKINSITENGNIIDIWINTGAGDILIRYNKINKKYTIPVSHNGFSYSIYEYNLFQINKLLKNLPSSREEVNKIMNYIFLGLKKPKQSTKISSCHGVSGIGKVLK